MPHAATTLATARGTLAMRPLAVLLAFTLLLPQAATLHAQDHAQPAIGSANGSSSNAGALAAWAAVIEREEYGEPPPEIARLVAAPRHLNVTLDNASPDRTRFLSLRSPGLPEIADYARPHFNLGGLQVDRRASRARTMTTRPASGIDIVDWQSGRTTQVQVPNGATVSNATWSPGGTQIAFFAHFPDATHLYVADATSGRARRLTRTPVLATLVTAFDWSADGRTIATVLLTDGRGAEPAAPAVPRGPDVRINHSRTARTRTFASLLANPHEQQLLEYFTTGQVALLDVASGAVRKVGRPAMIRGIDLAPDAQHLRVTTLERPFSYIVPVSSFGTREELWDRNGRVVAELATRPLREGGGRGFGADSSASPDSARRNLAWSPDGRGFVYLQLAPAAPRGAARDAAHQAADSARAPAASQRRRDRVVQWMPPFGPGDTTVLYVSDNRLSGVTFSSDGRALFLTETQQGVEHTFAVFLDEPSRRYTISRTRGGRGFGGGATPMSPAALAALDSAFFAHPGTLQQTRRGGQPVILVSSDGSAAYLEGTQYARDPFVEAPRPFVDRIDIRTGEKTRIFQSAADMYEQVTLPLDADYTRALVTRESPTAVQDAYVRDMATGALTKLTSNRNYWPEITAAQRRMVRVTRVDGVQFWVQVTLPASWQEGERLPALLWFYPREYTDQESYDRSRRTFNRNQFPNVGTRSMDFLTVMGYAVIQPDAPILGPSGRMNDNYVADLRNNLSAVIDELDRQRMIDRTRLGVGGHSYGAFSTVNAMVHTPFFKAGIAGDGNYNRSLTPNGFQSERRDLWEARETYLAMSPFFYAHQLNGALLMYHGWDDQNVGTAPENSTRLFHALQGLGKTASLYMYPYEDHGPATRETLLDLWSRWVAWLEVHVRSDYAMPTVTN